MVDKKIKLFVNGNADIVDASLSKADGGSHLDQGVRELVAATFPNIEIEVSHEASFGFGTLRRNLESDASRLIEEQPQIVLLSVAHDVRELGTDGSAIESAVHRIEADLVRVIDLIKERVGAHVLVANASTVDPAEAIFNYHEATEEPIALRAHRLDLMLIGVSHDEGVSIVDVDRKIAELGGARAVTAALEYSMLGCQVVAEEIVRIIDDYGFFDDRPLLAQVGARARE